MDPSEFSYDIADGINVFRMWARGGFMYAGEQDFGHHIKGYF
jgi:hypothetical protein